MIEKKNKAVIGLDIGGSHITSGVIDLERNTILDKTFFNSPVNNKDSKELILKIWADTILKSVDSSQGAEISGIAFAMPGPFEYHTGKALFERNDKYEGLYEVDIPLELSVYLGEKSTEMRFINDAMAFGIGSSRRLPDFQNRKIIAITLGTGFGSTFIDSGSPVFNPKNASRGGFLWDIPFGDGIADDYFSTRWFLKTFESQHGEKINGVWELTRYEMKLVKPVFREFAANLSKFLGPYIRDFGADTLIIGGNIAKAQSYFLNDLQHGLSFYDSSLKIHLDEGLETSALIGCAQLYDPVFFKSIEAWLSEL